MVSICLFCKSFLPDLHRVRVLVDSVERHNTDGIPFVLSVPRSHLQRFRDALGSARVEFTTDEDVVGRRVPQTWTGQQEVKMSFWRHERAAAALMLDADFIFLRDFARSDFLDTDGTPFFVVSEDSVVYEPHKASVVDALRGESDRPSLSETALLDIAAASRGPARPTLRRRILQGRADPLRDWFGRRGPALHFMPGPILSQATQSTFYHEYMIPNRLSYRGLLRMAPWEYVWLGEWALFRTPQDLRPISPRFLHFTSDEDLAHARSQGITREDIARAYLGVILAARHQSDTDY